MADIHIYLKGIRFRNSKGNLDLSTPTFPELIDDSRVTPTVRELLQIEPAFQFVTMPSPADRYLFHFELAEPDVVFTTAQGKAYTKLLPDEKVLIENIELTSAYQHCTVTVLPLNWPAGRRVVTLRLYCSHRHTPYTTSTQYGVNLVLLTPDGNLANPIVSSVSPPAACDFTFTVTDIVPFAKYNIFKYESVPPGISIEPIFRVNDARPTVKVAVKLGVPKVFRKSGAEVWVMMRNSPWPDALSKVEGGDLVAKFGYDAVEFPTKNLSAFSFLMGLEDPPPMLTAVTSPEAAYENPDGQRVPDLIYQKPNTRWPKVHVDPIILHDPPPSPIP